MSKPLLYLENVYQAYGDKVVLDNVDLSVQPGEICTLVGPSGCGKSTLFRLILGEESAKSGTVLLDGQPIGSPDKTRGIVPQRYSLYPHLNVLQNVTLGLRLSTPWWQWAFSRSARRSFEEQAMFYLSKVRLGDAAHKMPHELSGGMQQRVAIAQSLIMRPKILLMDEPFGALDPGTREDMQLFLIELWEELKMTIFFITHDLEEAVYLGTRVLVLSQFYSDDRGQQTAHRGAKIVCDYQLKNEKLASTAKDEPQTRALIQSILQQGFNPEYLQHVREFNLQHPHSFQSLTENESLQE